MAREVRSFAITVPAGTQPTAPLVAPLRLGPRLVREVRVRVPPGPSGKVGWALAAAGVRVVPWAGADWIVADDEVIDLPLEGQISTGAWELWAYNVGVFAHTLYIVFLLDPAQRPLEEVLRPPLRLTPAGGSRA